MKRISINILLILVISLSLTAAAFAKSPASETEPYIVVMKQEPVIAYEGGEAGLPATKPGKGGKVNPNSAHVKKYQKYLEASHDASLVKAGADLDSKVHDYTVALNGYSAFLTEAEVKSIEAQSDTVLVLPDVMRYPTTNDSPEYLGLAVKGGAYDSGITGEGVIVGVIDSGIWPEHPSFADDGSYPTAPVLDNSRPNCEFGNTAHNPDDAPFTCNNKLIGARQMLDTYRTFIGAEDFEFDSARDDDGHGTHTASTAAGNASVAASMYGVDLGEVSGIAPRAQIIAYKGLGALGGFTSDLASAIDQAVADGVDVINYSIGGGASLPTGADDIAFLFAANAGVFVATSAGNSGPGADSVGSPGNAPWLTTVGANTQSRFYEGTVKAEGGPTVKGASLTPGAAMAPFVDAEFAGGDLCIPGTLDATVAGKIVLCRRGAIARAAKSEAVFLAGGTGMVMYNNSDDDNLYTDTHAVPSVHVNNTDGLKLKEYIAKDGDKAQAEITDTGKVMNFAPAPSMTYFSSRGPNGPVPDLIKPDITAPGLQILAGQSPYADPFGAEFQAIAGTSMSSPHIAGVFALLKQAHPDWSAAMAKSALMTTADPNVRSEDQKTQATPFEMGSGQVDPGMVSQKGSAFNPGLVYDAGLFEYAAFTCGADLGIFTPGSCGFLESIGVPTESYNLNVPSIGVAEVAGSQTVVRTVTSVASSSELFNAMVTSPPGYEVNVTPSQMRLNPGESATFEVTIMNKNAPAGEWRFGSLSWKGGGYETRSPIAVNGALFGAPAEVAGTGAAGSTSFDVLFGYTGSYAAAPHGLVADAPTDDTISQDPDQAYPSGDDGAGGVDMINFPISGAAFVRWELVIPGDDDIDLFLENSSGTIVAASTNGGTDELIELTLPADDTYTMVVHGWSVPNEPLPYTLHYWEVPLTPGGSLNLDSAPASAAVGQTSTIDLSWSGLAAGTTYLGAVSHTGDAGLMGLTLVNVDVP